MEKYMKFTMFKKETTDKKYHNNPFRAINFEIGGDGKMRCPNGKTTVAVPIHQSARRQMATEL
jgi:hypothetical protein